ncbi:MAG TPA: phosphoenolpyruvate carboxykinase [Armatimonadota bacterium]|nr:phosphoenolpyruvate carboxykinase [Armatimonadota bacterium]
MSDTLTTLSGHRVIIRMTEMTCHTPQDVMRSPLVAQITQRFIAHLVKHDSPLLDALAGLSTDPSKDGVSAAANAVTDVLRLLVDTKPALICQMVPSFAPLVQRMQAYPDIVDKLYDFWRDYERYIIYEGAADASRDRAVEGHIPFIRANDDLKHLVLEAYRRIDSNLRGYWPRVYHQVPAGASVGLLVDNIDWPCPDGPYQILRDIPFVRLALLELPVVLYPKRNTRKGKFTPVSENPLEHVSLNQQEWYCMPLKVGQLVIHTFFHEDYLALASSLVNLFEVASHADARQKPDGIIVFGAPPEQLGEEQTVFFEDEERDIVLGVIGRSDDVDYFGYFKKMILTVHNVIMMRRGRLPVHGAMCRIELKDRSVATIVIIGDSGAGKSESLEAFRVLAHDHLRSMTIIFDDMGSLAITPDGKVTGYGTETGAFVRLDDLQPGYAFGQIDRSIFMNPHKTNARLVIPITTYEEITAGYPVDIVLYANNYEQVDDEEHGFVQIFDDPGHALHVFREGYRAAKGTTDERGLVHTYFANPFGPSQLKQRHDPLAKQFFHAMFDAGVQVGQLRTRLGIAGCEQDGPETAAKALFAHVQDRAKLVTK